MTDTSLMADETLSEAARESIDRLLTLQHPAGCWSFSVEADATIPAEYLLLQRFLGTTPDPGRRAGMLRYLRGTQLPDGGWPLYEGGAADVSATVKAYFALKLSGDPPGAPHMTAARRTVLDLGGAERVNVFTRITLALFGQIPWRTVPAIPVEIVLLPRWFFFHLDKVSYWSRTVMTPLLILCSRRTVCPLDPSEGVRELFGEPPETLRHLDRFVPRGPARKNAFLLLDRMLKRVDRLAPRATRERAVRIAEAWTRERMRGEGGIGAIFPAMANALMALKVLGCPVEDPDFRRGFEAMEGLLVERSELVWCQPCHSPVWDTALTLCALLEAGLPREHPAVRAAVDWLFGKQIFVQGDWAARVPGLAAGGWAFQFENDFYPDVDDTAKVLIAMLRAGLPGDAARREAFSRGVRWLLGMQSADGGWGAFDVDNNHVYLNDIPFADHGALCDPSTADVTARCVELLALLGHGREFPPVARALRFLRDDQEPCGAWFGRWGVNYIYGTWSVLIALRQVGEDMSLPYVRKAVEWLVSRQNADGGWGESCRSYDDRALAGYGPSTPSQTSWALLALMAAGEAGNPSVRCGIRYLLDRQQDGGEWEEHDHTGTGFPRVFYLRYHGYGQFFPLWALGTYRRLMTNGRTLEDEVRRSDPADLPISAAT